MTPLILNRSGSQLGENSVEMLNEVLKIDKESLIPLGFAFNTS